jgi:Putative polyhydroxyalkanoic acid system protein (PHA_gran_rgn)
LTGTRIVPEPIVVTISHALGRDEAKRRLDNGLGYIRDQLAAFVSSVDYGWTGYRLDFDLRAMRQSVTGRIEVEDGLVRVELGLPLLLRLLYKQIISRIRRDGALLLEKPSGANCAS